MTAEKLNPEDIAAINTELLKTKELAKIHKELKSAFKLASQGQRWVSGSDALTALATTAQALILADKELRAALARQDSLQKIARM